MSTDTFGQDRRIGRHFGPHLILLSIPVLCVVFFASVVFAGTLAWAPLIPLVLVCAALGGWLVLAAACGSPAAMMIYLGALAFLIDAQFRVRGAGDIQGDWQSALKFLVWLGAGVIGAPHLPPLRKLLSHPGSALWLAYITVALMSGLYSPAAGYSFGCALALLCLFAFSFALIKTLSQSQLLWTLTVSLAIFNLGGWIVFFALPELGTSAAWTTSGLMMRMCGLAGQATNLGALCTTAVGAVFILWWTGRCSLIAALLLGGFAFATLVKSDARTAEIAAMAAIGLVMVSRSLKLVVGGSFMAASLVILLQLFPKIPGMLGAQFSRSGDPTEVYTLTGRLDIWDFAWQQIKLSPIIGYGYNSSKVVLGGHIGFQNGLMVDSAHNLYLQNLLSVGCLGLVPLIGVLFYLAYRSCTRPVPIVLYTLVTILISSISDTDSIGTTPTLLTLMFFIVSIWPSEGEGQGVIAGGERRGRVQHGLRFARQAPAQGTARLRT
jgi:O-antigen ligase